MKIIKLGKEVDEKYYQFIDSEFEKYSKKNGINCGFNSFTYVAEDDGKTVGVLTGHSYYDEVHIGDLVVLEEYRHQHIGSQLVNQVIEEHRGKGFKNITLSTYEFQAKEFYKKLGFKVEFKRENKDNEKLNKYFMTKNY